MAYPPVTVYTTSTCPWCVRVKHYLTEKGVPFTEKNVEHDRSAAMEMIRRSGQTGVPVLTIGNDVVVGFDQARIERLLDAAMAGRPTFGASVADASKITAKAGKLPVFGAYVGKVAPGSPAARAGLQPHDIITELNFRPISNADSLAEALEAVPAGGRILVTWMRGQQQHRAETSF
jgi:glutaredoxin 3